MAKIHRIGFSVVSSGEKSRDGSDCQPVVNIIFIHGLRGHPRETWETPVHTPSDEGTKAKKTHRIRSIFGTKTKNREVPHLEASTTSHGTEPRSGQKIFWIEDFLPKDISNARILTYGYNADVIGDFFQANNQNSISQHGRDLKAKLERELENEAPIIFVAHSLGGIIAKDALCRSKSVRKRTKLMVFLGTPHRGSSFADWGQIASNIARLALQDSNKKILETLEVNNEILDNIQEAFKTIASEDGLIVHSFQEARGISGIKGLHNKVVDDFSSKVDLPSAQETVETIDANHMEMTKFSSKDDSGYRDVSGVLKRWTELPLKAQQVNAAEAPLPSFTTHPLSFTAVTPTADVHFMVPLQTNGELIGRGEYIQSLETKLCIPKKHCRVALVGLGGIGKTRIALEYTSKHKGSDSMSVFWVHASAAERMDKAYQEIAKKARLADAENPKVDQLQLVKNWLESEDSGQWLMVIDNADDENLFFGEDENQGQEHSFAKKLARYFPRRLNGSILLTTRNRRLGFKFATTVGGLITIPEMSISESKTLLAEKIGEDDYEDRKLTELVQVLENLPLALVQAATFIGENSQSIDEYLQMYRGSDSSKIDLLSQNFEDDERDPDNKNPVAVTWAISFEQIRKNDPRAAELLSLMSVLDRQAIPKSILSSDKEEIELEIALGTLKAYSLITVEQNGQMFNLHRLVYLATRNWLSMNEKLDSWTGNALLLLSELFPFPKYENQEIWMTYLPHAHAVLNSDQLPASENIAQAKLLINVSQAFYEKGYYDPAENMARKSSYLREKVLGKRNLKTLQSLSILAIVLGRQGKYDEAETLHRRALSCYEIILEENHPATLNSINNLASVLHRQGKYEEAEELYRQVLSVREKVPGKEHPDTLRGINNLASVLQKQGKCEEAEDSHRRALSAREKILGKEHLDTLDSINNLAVVLQYQGNYEEAEQLNRRALIAREKILGKEHPDTLRGINNLASVLQNQGNYKEAEQLHRRALSAREKILGSEHRDTLLSVWGLAYISWRQSQYQSASQLYQRAHLGHEKLLGSDHPYTQRCAQEYKEMLEDMIKSRRCHGRMFSERVHIER